MHRNLIFVCALSACGPSGTAVLSGADSSVDLGLSDGELADRAINEGTDAAQLDAAQRDAVQPDAAAVPLDWHANDDGNLTVRPAGSVNFGKGLAVSSDGLVLAVGNPEYDPTADAQSPYALQGGAVHIYVRSSTVDSFANVFQTIVGPDRQDGDFGWSIALSADGLQIAIGDWYEARVHLYRRGSPTAPFEGPFQTLSEPPNSPGRFGGDRFGSALAFSDDGFTLVVAALSQTIFQEDDEVFVFERARGDVGFRSSPSQVLPRPAEQTREVRWGNNLTLGGPRGSTLVVSSGVATFVFERSAGQPFVLRHSLAFGGGVSQSDDGRLLAIGGENTVRFFWRDGIGLPYGYRQMLSVGPLSEGFGTAIALRGDGLELFVGAPRAVAGSGTGRGVVWSFSACQTGCE